MTNEHTCSAETLAALKARVDALYLEYIFPVLATLRLGEDPETIERENRLMEAAKAAGIRVRRYIMPEDLTQAEVEQLIREINADFLLTSLLVFRPLPKHLDEAALLAVVAPEKALEAAPWEILLTRVADAAERKAR